MVRVRIIIYGAGAVGSIIGGYLHHSKHEVVLVCSKEHADAIRTGGLRITGVQGNYEIRMSAVTGIEQVSFGSDDAVFLTMKTFDTEEALDRLARVAPKVPVVCFQNAVRNEEFAASRFARVYGGIVFFGAKYLEPGIVNHTSENSLGIGLYPRGLDSTVDALNDVLTRAGFSVTAYPNIMAVKWSKLFRNLNNALFAITGLSVLAGIKYEQSRFMMADTLEEALRVVKAEGIEIVPLAGHQPPEKMIESLRKPGERSFDVPDDEEAALRPSTWQDLYLKRGRTEVEYLNGEIVRLGRKHGIPTPLNSLMVNIVSKMARERLSPGAYTIRQLRDTLGEGEKG
ncbi:MAG: ketopantoate reductase family protein [Candidatus Abyssobacteria bacterium SURF_17]|uniref:2-dehydropantoate 2-reductase n=1 Tax=Candidatus Abyssobacteria bacterium SURF_17 TaxID=2093361 RepID=A0A419F4K6_9BACT|nr:MAG: ketopantoate reductase family protein [Candidatus Abyssubacteria bacterium SURF_17]